MAPGYVERSLTAGEVVLYRARITPWLFAPAVALGVIGLLINGVVVLLALVLAGAIAVYVFTTEIAVTNKKVVGKWGLLRQSTIEQRLSRISALTTHRVLGAPFGSVSIRGGGGEMARLDWLEDPMALKRHVEQALEQADSPVQAWNV